METWKRKIASGAHSGRMQGFPELARAVTPEQASGIPVTKGCSPFRDLFPPRDENDFPRADDGGEIGGEIVCRLRRALPHFSSPSFLSSASGLELGVLPPTGKGGWSAGPPNGRLCCTSGVQDRTARLASAEPAKSSSLEGRRPGSGIGDGAGSSPRGKGPGTWGCGRGARRGRASGGAPGVGGAGGAGVNVRPAPATLTQFHQKPGEEVAKLTRHRGGSGGPSRAGSRDRNLGRGGPTPLTCAGNPGPRARGGDRAGSEHVWPFVLRCCVCRGT